MHTLLTLTGPTCSGKSHLQQRLTKPEYGGRMGQVVTATTRPVRKNEIPGVDYFFYDRADFEAQVKEGAMLESAEFSGHWYGTPLASLHRAFAQGNGCAVQVIEPQGLKSIRQAVTARGSALGFNLRSCFVDCPREVVAMRFMQRYRADLGKALAEAPGEIEAITRYYERRLVSILGVEVDWRREATLVSAELGSGLYDLVIDEFGAETESQVIERILQRIN